MTDPKVGDKFVATDNHAAANAMGLPLTPMPVFYVTVSHVWPDHRKVQVVDDDYWLSFDDLAAYFRPVGAAA